MGDDVATACRTTAPRSRCRAGGDQALLDPEPASKVALAVGSAALAVIILQRLGIEPEPGFEGA